MRLPAIQAVGLMSGHLLALTQSIIVNKFINRIAILGSGTALAQLANIVATPLLAFLYSPSDFGTMAVFMGVVIIIGSLAGLCYEAAIILPEDREEARSVGLLSLTIAAVVSLLAGVILCAVQSLGYVDLLSPWKLLLLIPIGVFALGAFNAGCNWRMRSDDVKALSIASIIRTVGALFCQIVAALLGFQQLGLILGRLIGQVSATLYVFRSTDLVKWDAPSFRVDSLAVAARKHRSFPFYRAPQSFLALLTEQIPAFALGFLFGSGPAGLYWLAHRVLKLPCTVLSEAAAKVYYSECARRYRRSEAILYFTLKTVFGLAGIAILPSILLFVFSPILFGILGDEWRQAGDYGRWLSIWTFFVFCCSPVMIVFAVMEKQSLLLKIDTISMFLRVIMIGYLSYFGSAMLMVIFISIFESVKIFITTALIFILCQSVDKREQSLRVGGDELS